MKVFLSWSKPKSQRFAELLREWLPEIVQEIEPWMSSEDIEKGQRWASEIGEQLGTLNQGILCVTAENAAEPWLNFEAGALAKSLETARVHPLLLDLRPSDVTGPLTLFQATHATDSADMLKLLVSLNNACQKPLGSDRLTRAFERVWPSYEEKVQVLQKLPTARPGAKKRSDSDMIVEILDRLREMQRTFGPNPRPESRAFARELARRLKAGNLTITDLSAATRIPEFALTDLLRGRKPTARELYLIDRFLAADGAPVGIDGESFLDSGLARLIPTGPPPSNADGSDDEAEVAAPQS